MDDTARVAVDQPTVGEGRRLEEVLAEQLVERARAEGVQLTGPGGLLTGLTRQVLETALGVELAEHLGHEPGERSGSGNVRNGRTPKTVQTDVGPVRIEVPRDRNSTFEPQVVPKHGPTVGGVQRGHRVALRQGPNDR